MAILPAGLFILILQCLDTVNAGKVTVNNNPQVRVTTNFTNWDARIMDQWSKGGGQNWTIGEGHPFQGRSFGGATRDKIKGTSAYGSGYPYGSVTDLNTISGRPFPYGVWPIYWGNNFMGSDEYGPQNDGIRPGGQLVIIPLKGDPNYYPNLPADDTYYAIGDRDSTLGIMVSFVTWCHVKPAWPSKFQPTSPNSTVKIENVITYYRASSFALASPNYNNTAARTPFTNDPTSLPESIQASKVWQCLDSVVSNALMIMNPPPPKPESLGVTLGIIFGVLGLPILVALTWFGCILVAWGGNIKKRVERGKELKRQEAERRKAALAYENYP